MIPQSNPKAGYLARKPEIDEAIQRVLESGWYILGHEVESFEREFAEYTGVAHAVGVANGTDAIELALRACGVGRGDVVVTVSLTAVATVSAISRVGAEPVFVDIGEDFLMSPDSLAQVLKSGLAKQAKAVIVVHLYGQIANMPAIIELARHYGISIIEDCAQAHGAMLHGRKAGSWGHIGCFSFYPTKNLGALGDAGAVVTGDEKIADKVRVLRQYGWRQRYISDEQGVNSRLDELQAAVLRVKLKGLEADNRRRREIAAIYRERLTGVSLCLPHENEGGQHVYHQFVVQCSRRDFLAEELKAMGVATAIHYPAAVHKQAAYSASRYRSFALPVTEEITSRILSLPMFPELSTRKAEIVANSIIAALNNLDL